MVSKPLIVFSLLGYYWFGAQHRSPMVIAALFFGWLGDIFLLWNDFFIFGLVAFLIGHLLYILVYRQYRYAQPTKAFLATQKVRYVFPILLLGTGLVAILYPKLGDLKIPVLVYAVVLTLMSVVAFFRYGYTTDKSFLLVMAGALLFMVSDSLLAVNKFLSTFPFSGIAVMITYCAAQYLIVEGLIKHPQL
jgi:uncharacterized membrane protein YhhN